jgi:hypothetical protein
MIILYITLGPDPPELQVIEEYLLVFPVLSNILNQLDNIKVDATLLDMVSIPKQQKHIKNFMEGEVSTIAKI